MGETPGDVTRLLGAWAGGDEAARDRLVPLVYKELRALAGHFMRRERAGHTLQPTALVNEAFVRFFKQRAIPAQGREQFLALIAQMMRRVLVDHARMKAASKRGDGVEHVTLNDELDGTESPALAILDVDRVLERLAALDPRQAQVVEMRIFGGFEVTEVATALGVSPATVKREWRTAKVWLSRELSR